MPKRLRCANISGCLRCRTFICHFLIFSFFFISDCETHWKKNLHTPLWITTSCVQGAFPTSHIQGADSSINTGWNAKTVPIISQTTYNYIVHHFYPELPLKFSPQSRHVCSCRVLLGRMDFLVTRVREESRWVRSNEFRKGLQFLYFSSEKHTDTHLRMFFLAVVFSDNRDSKGRQDLQDPQVL